MVVGIDVYHDSTFGKKKSVVGFVASNNKYVGLCVLCHSMWCELFYLNNKIRCSPQHISEIWGGGGGSYSFSAIIMYINVRLGWSQNPLMYILAPPKMCHSSTPSSEHCMVSLVCPLG